jgi:hypothetical protein
MRIRTIGPVLAVAALAACQASELNITNPNQATVAGASADPSALQLLATGLLADYRGQTNTLYTPAGNLGRESYTFSPQDGRSSTTYLIGYSVGGVQKIDPAAGFASTTAWTGPYGMLRDIYNFKNTVAASTLSAAQKSAALGFAQTLEAHNYLILVAAHDTLGLITEIKDNAADLAPFVSRDSVYKFILGTLDAAAANLAGGGSAFPFNLHSGFTGFNTPATFAPFNRALKAKAAAYYATSGGGATAWQAALAALGASYLNASATTRAQFDAGPAQIYSTATGDAANPFSVTNNTTLYAHMSLQTDAQLKADGTPDNRYTAKIRTGLPSRQGPVTADGPTSAASTLGFSMWPVQTTPVSILRNEELILLRAEAKLATGDKAGAIADLNQVRVNSGGLPASTLTAASSDDAVLTGILYEKRYSTMLEGNRWVDMRRYNKLSLLPLDIASGPNKNFVAKVFPITQGECLVRAKATGNLLGPNGQNNCAP